MLNLVEIGWMVPKSITDIETFFVFYIYRYAGHDNNMTKAQKRLGALYAQLHILTKISI